MIKWIIFVVHIYFTICVLLTANIDGRFAQPMIAPACVTVEGSVQSHEEGGGAWSWRAGAGGAAQQCCELICQQRIQCCWAATAGIMIEYNGEKWKQHGLRLQSTPTEIWTGLKNPAAVWFSCRCRHFLGCGCNGNLCNPGLKKDKGAWNYTDVAWSWATSCAS